MSPDKYTPDNSPAMRFNNLFLQLQRLQPGPDTDRLEKNDVYGQLLAVIPELPERDRENMKARVEELFNESLQGASPADQAKELLASLNRLDPIPEGDEKALTERAYAANKIYVELQNTVKQIEDTVVREAILARARNDMDILVSGKLPIDEKYLVGK